MSIENKNLFCIDCLYNKKVPITFNKNIISNIKKDIMIIYCLFFVF